MIKVGQKMSYFMSVESSWEWKAERILNQAPNLESVKWGNTLPIDGDFQDSYLD